MSVGVQGGALGVPGGSWARIPRGGVTGLWKVLGVPRGCGGVGGGPQRTVGIRGDGTDGHGDMGGGALRGGPLPLVGGREPVEVGSADIDVAGRTGQRGLAGACGTPPFSTGTPPHLPPVPPPVPVPTFQLQPVPLRQVQHVVPDAAPYRDVTPSPVHEDDVHPGEGDTPPAGVRTGTPAPGTPGAASPSLDRPGTHTAASGSSAAARPPPPPPLKLRAAPRSSRRVTEPLLAAMEAAMTGHT